MHKSQLSKHNIRWRARCMLIILVASILQACHQETLYHTFCNLPPTGWKQKDTVCFDVAACNSQTIPCQLYVEVRNRSEYPYQNLPLAITLVAPDSTVSFHDTLSLQLANEESKWTGKGWGGIYQKEFSVSQLLLNQTGHYRFYITHCLKDNPVPGINDIGIRLDLLDQTSVSSGINAQEDKKQDGEAPQR